MAVVEVRVCVCVYGGPGNFVMWVSGLSGWLAENFGGWKVCGEE